MKSPDRKQTPLFDARRVLAVSCWIVLLVSILSFFFTLHPVQRWVSETTIGAAVTTGVLIVTFVAAIAGWIAALVHAWRESSRYLTPRWILMGVLLIGSFAASFFYYFLFVHWQRRSAGSSG